MSYLGSLPLASPGSSSEGWDYGLGSYPLGSSPLDEFIDLSGVTVAGGASVSGQATIEASAVIVRAGQAEVVGNAFISADAVLNVINAAADVVGNAFIQADAITRKMGSATLQAGAVIEADSTLTRPVSQNTRSVFDFSNQSNFQLLVSNTPIDFTGCRFKIDELSLSYDNGKVVSFSEISTATYGTPTYNMEEEVVLKANDGNGLRTFFTGKIRTRTHRGENNNEGVSYVAVGIPQLANDVEIEQTPYCYPEISVGPTVIPSSILGFSAEELPGGLHLYPTVREAVTTVFSLMGTKLSSHGIPIAYDLTNLSTDSLIYDELRLSGGFFGALSQVVAHEPGAKPWFDDTDQTWKFVKPLDEVVTDLRINSVNVCSHSYNYSTEGRYTAVQLYARANVDLKQQFYVNSLVPWWDPLLQATWTYPQAGSELSPQDSLIEGLDNAQNNQHWPVYRRWIVTNTIQQLTTASDIKVYYKTGTAWADEWVEVEADIVFPTPVQTASQQGVSPYVTTGVGSPVPYLTVYTNQPLIVSGNPYQRGDAVGVTTAIRLSITNVVTATLQQCLRYPPSGYEGTAFSLHGIDRTHTQIVNFGEATERNARNILRTRKDVVISGDLPIEGDPVFDFWNLRRTVVLTHSTNKTGIETLAAPVMQYQYRFDKRGENILSLNNDAAAVIKQTR